MKKCRIIIPFILSAFMLSGCSDKNKNPISDDSTAVTTAQTTEFQPVTEAANQRTLPVLSIETVSKDSNVMDFVKKPVAPHVAEDVASWTPNYKMPPEPYYEECKISLKDSGGEVLLSEADGKVKVRGNWTTLYPKKPLRIKFAEKQGMLGLNDGAEQKNWLLLAEYKDGSMLRNKTALSVSREIMSEDGYFAPDSELVQVEINGEYYGIYLLTDMLQTGSSRINITEPEKDYTGTDIGYFMEFDGYFTNEDELHGFPLTLADNAPLTPFDGNGGSGEKVKCLKTSIIDPKKDVGMTIKSTVNSAEQHDFIENFVNNVYTIMYEAAYNDTAYSFDADYKNIAVNKDITPRQAVENVVDVQSLADIYIISELTCDADIYWSSFYMDADFGADGNRKLTFEAPWDFDSAMGCKDRCITGEGFYASNIVPDVNGGRKGGGEYDTVNPWLVVLAYEDWYQDIIKEKWTKAYDEGVFSQAVDMVRDDSSQLQEEFRRNYEKWDNILKNEEFAGELSEPALECRDQLEAANFLAEWLTKRVAFLNEQWHT